MTTHEHAAAGFDRTIDVELTRVIDDSRTRLFMGRWGVENAGIEVPTMRPDTIASAWYGMRFDNNDETPVISAVTAAENLRFKGDVQWYYGSMTRDDAERSDDVAATAMDLAYARVTNLLMAISNIELILPNHPSFDRVSTMENVNKVLEECRALRVHKVKAA